MSCNVCTTIRIGVQCDEPQFATICGDVTHRFLVFSKKFCTTLPLTAFVNPNSSRTAIPSNAPSTADISCPPEVPGTVGTLAVTSPGGVMRTLPQVTTDRSPCGLLPTAKTGSPVVD